MKNTYEAAFPRQNDDKYFGELGMSLRDYFAAHALAGMLANPSRLLLHPDEEDLATGVVFARRAYLFADAMLAERGSE